MNHLPEPASYFYFNVNLMHLLICIAIHLPQGAGAFFPSQPLTLFAPLSGTESHEEITEDVFVNGFETKNGRVPSILSDLFGIVDADGPMLNAIDQIIQGNIRADENQAAKIHFDGEKFTESLQFFDENIARTINYWAFGGIPSFSEWSYDYENRRQYLGFGLHTLQDFYAHSNWIEVTDGETSWPAFLTGDENFPIKPAGPEDPVCKDGIPLQYLLTSGYYGDSGGPVERAKFIHGGPLDSLDPVFLPPESVYCGGLNKDSSASAYSPHYHLHTRAAMAAKVSTREFITNYFASPGDKDGMRMLRTLLGADVMDISPLPFYRFPDPFRRGSGDYNGGVQWELTREKPASLFASSTNYGFTGSGESIAGHPEHHLVDYAEFLTSHEPQTRYLRLRIFNLLHECMFRMHLPSDVLIEECELLQYHVAESDSGGIEAFVTRSLVPHGRNSMYFVAWPYAFYRNIGNTVHDIRPSDGPAYEYLLRLKRDPGSRSGIERHSAPASEKTFDVRLFSRDFVAGDTTKTGAVYVDEGIDSISFSILQNALVKSNSLEVFSPSGKQVVFESTNVLSTGGLVRTSYLLHGPPFGTWSFRVPGPDPCTLTVDGTSPLNIEAVQLLSVSGRPGHEGYAAIVGAPVAGGTSKMRARIHSRGTRCGIRFEDFAGRTLGSYVATRDEGPGSFFYCDAVVPQVPFFVVAVVTDVSGVAVERRLESPFSPKSLRVDARSAQSFSTDGSNKLFFTVRNFGSTAALDLEVTNDFGFVCSLDRNSLVLTNGEVATIGFAVSAREDIDMEMVSFARFRISAAVKERPASDNFTELVASVDHGILDESLPKLSIVHSGNQVTVEWNGNGVLEQSNDIYFGWHPVANSSNPLTVEVSSEAVFYRVVRMSARATARALRFDAGWGAGYSGDAPRGLLRFKHGQ